LPTPPSLPTIVAITTSHDAWRMRRLPDGNRFTLRILNRGSGMRLLGTHNHPRYPNGAVQHPHILVIG
jgi:hypothetical protein